jgi:hypothetical protein
VYNKGKGKGKVDKGKAKVMAFDIPYEKWYDFGSDVKNIDGEGISDLGDVSDEDAAIKEAISGEEE